MTFVDYLRTSQLYQFILTVLVFCAYIVSMYHGTPDDTLKSILLVVISYWFVSVVSKPTMDNLNNNVQSLHDAVNTNGDLPKG